MHIEALKIFSGETPLTPITRGGGAPPPLLPPLVPSALVDFLRRTTFKNAATALRKVPDVTKEQIYVDAISR